MNGIAVIAHNKDNVATATGDLPQGTSVTLKSQENNYVISLSQNIDYGHKFSLVPIKKGSHVVKYGEIIGLATTDINVGEHVHVHNIASARGRGDLENMEMMEENAR